MGSLPWVWLKIPACWGQTWIGDVAGDVDVCGGGVMEEGEEISEDEEEGGAEEHSKSTRKK